MNAKCKCVCFSILIFVSFAARAEYPGFNAGAICNNYPNFTGYVTKFTSATTYDGYEDTWVEVTSESGQKNGGKLYYRSPTESGYTPLVTSLRAALATGIKVTICVNGNDVYAVELAQ